jgi:tetratricopeptide (TPR) repeat protein
MLFLTDIQKRCQAIVREHIKTILALSFIVVITVITFYPSIKNGFVWDDAGYILGNSLIKRLSLDNMKKMMTTFFFSNYHPLVLITYAWEYFFFKLNPLPYHVVNVLLHLINCSLVFFFFKRLTSRNIAAFVVATLFAIHPLHVESVAWVSSRKDLLYSLFYLSSLISYLTYLGKEQPIKYYWFALFLFLLSLLSKSMAVTLPLVLFLIDYYYHRKINFFMIKEKLPFFFLASVFGIFAIFSQQKSISSEITYSSYSFLKFFFVGTHGLLFYIFKTFVPINLSAFYPYPDGLPLTFFISPIIVIFFFACFLYFRKHVSSNIVFGIAFYVITLLPVLQFLPVGVATAADRYTYIPLLGIFYIIGEAFAWLEKTIRTVRLRIAGILCFFLAIALLAIASNHRCRIWQNNLTLWTDVIHKYPRCAIAYGNRGAENVLKDRNKAFSDTLTAINLAPPNAGLYNNLCIIYYLDKDQQKALEYCKKAIDLEPGDALNYKVLGDAYLTFGNRSLAIESYQKALSINPYFGPAHSSICSFYLSAKQYEDAYQPCKTAMAFDPDNEILYMTFGNIYLQNKQYENAFRFYLGAIVINPRQAEAHNNLAFLYYLIKDYTSSLKHLKLARSSGYVINTEFENLLKSRTTNNEDNLDHKDE